MKKILTLSLFILLVALSGCIGSEKADKAKLETPKIRLGLMPDLDSIPFLVAEKNGYFKEVGVEVELVHFKSAMERDAELQSKHIDGAVSDLLALLLAKEGGFELKGVSSTDGTYNLIASPKENSHTVADMKTKSIAISKNTIIEYVTDKILEKNNLSEVDINKTIIPQIPARLEMLASGEVVGATLPEPLASVATYRGGQYIIGSSELGINPGIVLFSAEFLEHNTDAVNKLYIAYNQAVDFVNKNPREEYLDFVSEKIGFPAEIKEALEIPRYRHATPVANKDLDEVIRWLTDKELIKKSYSYEDVIVKVR